MLTESEQERREREKIERDQTELMRWLDSQVFMAEEKIRSAQCDFERVQRLRDLCRTELGIYEPAARAYRAQVHEARDLQRSDAEILREAKKAIRGEPSKMFVKADGEGA